MLIYYYHRYHHPRFFSLPLHHHQVEDTSTYRKQVPEQVPPLHNQPDKTQNIIPNNGTIKHKMLFPITEQ